MTKQDLEREIAEMERKLESAKSDLNDWGMTDQPVELTMRYDVRKLQWRIVAKLPDGHEGFIDLGSL